MTSALSGFQLKLGSIDGVFVWNSVSHQDKRGRFYKTYTEGDNPTLPFEFKTVEHFFTESKDSVFRGLHFQGDPHAANKIVTIARGSALDFLLDLRTASKTFGNLQTQELDGNTSTSIYIPAGIAHGYLSRENGTIISYRQDRTFCENCDSGVNAKVLSHHLPVALSNLIVSDRDRDLESVEKFEYLSGCHK